MTFLGFQIDNGGNLLEYKTREILEAKILDRQLSDALKRNYVDLNEDFDKHSRFVHFQKIIITGISLLPIGK